MKRKVLLLAFSTLISVGASAQLQVGVKAGYALPAAAAPLGVSTDGSSSTTIYGTFGSGIPVGLEVAYFLSDNFGVQLDASYLIGSSMVTNEVLTSGATSSMTSKTSQLRVTPSLVFKTDIGLYSRFGLILPLLGNTTTVIENENGGGPGIPFKQEIVAKGKFGAGFDAALGYQFGIGDKLSIFGELQYIGLSIKRASTELTMYEVGGVDLLPNLTDDQKNTTYEDSTTPTGNNAQGTSSPYSSIGLNLGVRIKIGE